MHPNATPGVFHVNVCIIESGPEGVGETLKNGWKIFLKSEGSFHEKLHEHVSLQIGHRSDPENLENRNQGKRLPTFIMANILIIEDDRLNGLIMDRVLTRMGGHQTKVTEDADEALSMIRHGQVDLIVMDVSLTNTVLKNRNVDGIVISRLLKANPKTRPLPIIIATAHAMKGDREALLARSHADTYISKPIVDHREFCQFVDRTIKSSLKAAV